MAKRTKVLGKLRNNSSDATFRQIENLLLSEDFVLERVTGSHHIFKKGSIVFVIPVHNNRVKSVYVKRVIEILEEKQK